MPRAPHYEELKAAEAQYAALYSVNGARARERRQRLRARIEELKAGPDVRLEVLRMMQAVSARPKRWNPFTAIGRVLARIAGAIYLHGRRLLLRF